MSGGDMERAEGESNRGRAEGGGVEGLLATLSHEIRTPLSAVVGYADLLEAGIPGPLNDTQRAYVLRIRESAWAVLAVIDRSLQGVAEGESATHRPPEG